MNNLDACVQDQDRRILPRLSLHIPLQISLPSAHKKWRAISVNMHHQGALVQTDREFPAGAELSIDLPDGLGGENRSGIEAEICWKEQIHTAWQYGLKFKNSLDWNLALNKDAFAVAADDFPGAVIQHSPEMIQQSAQQITTDKPGADVSQFVLDSINDGVFSVDKKRKITFFNSAAEALTGWRAEEVIGMPCQEVFKSSNCNQCFLAESISCAKAIADRSLFITTRDGKRLPVNINTMPLYGDDGALQGGVQVFRDVDALKTRGLILDSIADGVFTVDREWKITSFNRAAEHMTGVPAEEAIGRSCSEIFHASICGENCAVAYSMCTGQAETNRSITIQGASGTRLPVSVCAAPLVDSLGNVIGGVESIRDLTLIASLKRKLSRFQIGDLISKSPSMQRIFSILPDIAQSDSNVLLLGESGTGKELMAKAIHEQSERSKEPFVAVNCGALPETLLESELFGYTAGAFTDARKDRAGRFAAAEKGTLFLDEIGDIATPVQVKLLRVLQERKYEPLGSTVPVEADVRVVAATHRDLESLMRDGTFRDDLYYRLNVVKLFIPPLRERQEDIPILIEHIIEQFNDQRNKDIGGVADSTMALLLDYKYPGNVRELQNIIEYAFILCQGGLIQPEHLPEPFKTKKQEDACWLGFSGPITMEEAEKILIEKALNRNKWKKMATCRELKISKDTLRRKIKRFELKQEDVLSRFTRV